MKKKKVKIPIYGGLWTIVISEGLSEVEKKYNLSPTEGFSGLCITRFTKKKGKEYMTAFDAEKLTPGIITHECVHLINHIFSYHGVELDVNNDEHQAYFMAWAVNQVFDLLKAKVKLKL